MKTITFDENSDVNEHIPGLPYTHKERAAELIKAEKDHDSGKSMSHEDFVKEMNTWF